MLKLRLKTRKYAFYVISLRIFTSLLMLLAKVSIQSIIFNNR